MRLRRAWPGIVLSLLPLAACVGCGHGSGAEAKASAATAPEAVPVTVAKLEHQVVEQTVPIEGTLRAWEEVTISAKKGGRVRRVLHDMGDRVKPGELLVELETTDAELAVRQAETKYLGALVKLGITREQAAEFVARYGGTRGVSETLLRGEGVDRLIEEHPSIRQAVASRDQARQDLNRQQQLNTRGVGTLQELQNAENDFRMAQAVVDNAYLTARNTIADALQTGVALKVAERDLAEMRITAPEPSNRPDSESPGSGPVEYAITTRMVSEGQLLKDGEAVFNLMIEDPIRLRANVPERYRPQMAVGQSVRVAAMSRSGQEFAGRISRINPSVDSISRTIQVEALIPNPEGLLRPGGFAKGAIVTRSDQQAVVVPIESVYRFAGVTKIFLIEDHPTQGSPVSRGYPVETGRQLAGGQIEVHSPEQPLPQDGLVVTTGLTKLAEGTPVVIRQPDDPESAKPAGTSEPTPTPAKNSTL